MTSSTNTRSLSITLRYAITKLRLDANGGLTLEQAKQWLEITEKFNQVEFIEQPLPPEKFETMLALAKEFSMPLALDESVANIEKLKDCYHRGWRDIYVIKAGIFGFPQVLRNFLAQHPIKAVFSSVLETEIGRQAALRLATELNDPHFALGFGVDHWFV